MLTRCTPFASVSLLALATTISGCRAPKDLDRVADRAPAVATASHPPVPATAAPTSPEPAPAAPSDAKIVAKVPPPKDPAAPPPSPAESPAEPPAESQAESQAEPEGRVAKAGGTSVEREAPRSAPPRKPETPSPGGGTYRGPVSPSTPGPSGPATAGPSGPATGGRGNVTGSDDFYMGGARRDTSADAESYAPVVESGFILADSRALSTFAADVDTAAYANLRRFLAESRLPPADAVRIEELVNAQIYDDPAPAGRDLFAVTTELGACPWNADHLLLRIGLRTRPIETAKLPPCNLVFLIDVSGSMSSADKLPLVQRAMQLLVAQLRPQDKLSIVTYAAGVNEPLPPTSGADRARILEVLTNLRASGGTNGAGGIQRAYELAQANLVPEGTNRVVLATDGDFNVGIREPAALERFIVERRDLGVFLTVLGVGSGNLKDDRLERLADKGNGVYAYLDGLAEARRVLVEQFGASMMTVAKDVKLQLEFEPSQVAAYRQIGYENRQMAARDFRDDHKDGGELGAGHSMTALYELVPTAGRDPATPVATLRLRYKPPLGDVAREIDRSVDGRLEHAPSRSFRVAAVAAGLGMLLRGSPHLGSFGWGDLAARAADPGLGAPDLARTVAAAQALNP